MGHSEAWAAWLFQAVLHQHCPLSAFEWVWRDWPAPMRARVQNQLRLLFRHGVAWRQAVHRYLERPLPDKHFCVEVLIGVGVCYASWGELHPARVHHLVQGCEALDRPWAKGVVNACLRAIASEPQVLMSGWPKAWVKLLKRSWPDDVDAILAAYEAPARLSVRRRWGEGVAPERLGPLAVEMYPQGTNLATIAGFNQGQAVVQDMGAQLAVALLPKDLVKGPWLDACAAPGGKTLLLLDTLPGVHIDAVDVSQARVDRLSANLRHWGVHDRVTVRLEDARCCQGQGYAGILLDAPCSGSGVVHKHPEIAWVRRAKDVQALVRVQRELLETLWPKLLPGGVLVYMTCSLFRDENDGVLASFLQGREDANVEVEPLPFLRSCHYGQQLLPGPMNHGFYVSCLRKC